MSIAALIRNAAAAIVVASGATFAQQAQPPTWETMPRMQLEQQFAEGGRDDWFWTLFGDRCSTQCTSA